jgi:hypothetical protein
MIRDILTVFAVLIPYSLLVYVRGYRDGTQYGKGTRNGRA